MRRLLALSLLLLSAPAAGQVSVNGAGGVSVNGVLNAVMATSADFDSLTITPATSSALTDLLVNPAVKSSGNLIQAKVGASSKLSLDYAGVLTIGAGLFTTSGLIETAANTEITLQTANQSGAASRKANNIGWSTFTNSVSPSIGTAIKYTYNQTGATGMVNTDLQLSRTETSLGTTPGAQSLIDALVGGTTRFNVSTLGNTTQTTVNGASVTWGNISELLTVVAANTSTTVADLLPANSIIDAVTWRVTVGIPAAGTFSVGDGTTAGRFGTGAAVAASSSGIGLAQNNPTVTDAAGPVQTAAAKIVVTFSGGDPSDATGRVRFTVFYHAYGAPAPG